MLINQSAVKEYIKLQCESNRPGWKMERVSASALQNIDAKLRMIIKKAVQSHPTVGKTFNFELGE